MEGTAPSAVGRARLSNRWLLVGAIAAVVLLVVVYLVGGSGVASGSVARADAALKMVARDNSGITAVFKSDPFTSVNITNPDVRGAENQLAAFNEQLARWQSTVTDDRNALTKVRHDLDGSVLTLPENSTLQSRRTRVDAGRAALQSAQQAIDILKKQANFMDSYLAVMRGLAAIGEASNAQNVAAVESALSTTSAAMQQTTKLAAVSDLPPELNILVFDLQKGVNDLNAMYSAVKAQDQAASSYDLWLLAIDTSRIKDFDAGNLHLSEVMMFTSLHDSYDTNMKIALAG